MGECYLLRPLFPGNNNKQQLQYIQRLLGSLSRKEKQSLKCGTSNMFVEVKCNSIIFHIYSTTPFSALFFCCFRIFKKQQEENVESTSRKSVRYSFREKCYYKHGSGDFLNRIYIYYLDKPNRKSTQRKLIPGEICERDCRQEHWCQRSNTPKDASIYIRQSKM